MAQKDKAIELINKYLQIYDGRVPQAKKCALICVDEIIEQWDYIDTYIADLQGTLNPNLKYWYEVKSEIENYENSNIHKSFP